MKNAFAWKFSKIDKRAGWNKGVQVGFFPKIINCAALLLDGLQCVDKKWWVGGQSNVYVRQIDLVKMALKSLLLSTKGRWVVKKAQKSVYIVIE